MKTFTILAIGGAVLIAGSYLYGINKSQYKIVLTATGRIHKVTAQGVTLIIRYNIKNPTTAAMRMTPPLIRITVNGKQIATSNMREIDIPEASRDDSGKIIIRANQETGDIESEVIIPWVGLISTAPDLISRLQNTDGKTKVSLKVETQARIYTMLGVFPYEQNTTIKV
jgi:hypothetical protein